MLADGPPNRFAIRAGELVLADAVGLAIEGLLYFVSLAGPLALLVQIGADRPLILLAAVLVGYLVALVIFLGGIVVLRRVLFPSIVPGRFIIRNPNALPPMLSARLMAMVKRSPFVGMMRDVSFLRWAFLRGMGARIDPTFVMVDGAFIEDPWLFSAGKNCVMGVGSLISCHFAQHSVITLEPVTLGDDVTIGAGALISPGVTIGDGAVVGAGAAVARRTAIGPGEFWSGNPARKIDLFAGDRGASAVKDPSIIKEQLKA
jgi:acetyltransferase-like isoleucine patch superfamily enzyme